MKTFSGFGVTCGWGCCVSKQDLHRPPDQKSPFCASCTPAALPGGGRGLPVVLSMLCSRATLAHPCLGTRHRFIPAQSPFRRPPPPVHLERAGILGDLLGPGPTNRGEETAPESCTLRPLDLRTGCKWNWGTKMLLHLLTMIHQKLGSTVGVPSPAHNLLPSTRGPTCLGSISA